MVLVLAFLGVFAATQFGVIDATTDAETNLTTISVQDVPVLQDIQVSPLDYSKLND